MPRLPTRPVLLCAALLTATAIPILVSLVRLGQIPTGTLPPESLRFAEVPFRHFAHAAAGATFAVLGPLQFMGAFALHFGRLHRLFGRVFFLAGLILAASGLGLLAQFPTVAIPPLQLVRGLAGLALLLTPALGLRAALQRRIPAHRAWMIRAYALGIGSTAVSLIALPLAVLGRPLTGASLDLALAGAWIATVLLAEAVIAGTGPGKAAATYRPEPLATPLRR